MLLFCGGVILLSHGSLNMGQSGDHSYMYTWRRPTPPLRQLQCFWLCLLLEPECTPHYSTQILRFAATRLGVLASNRWGKRYCKLQ